MRHCLQTTLNVFGTFGGAFALTAMSYVLILIAEFR